MIGTQARLRSVSWRSHFFAKLLAPLFLLLWAQPDLTILACVSCHGLFLYDHCLNHWSLFELEGPSCCSKLLDIYRTVSEDLGQQQSCTGGQEMEEMADSVIDVACSSEDLSALVQQGQHCESNFPSFEVEIRNVTAANPDGMSHGNLNLQA